MSSRTYSGFTSFSSMIDCEPSRILGWSRALKYSLRAASIIRWAAIWGRRQTLQCCHICRYLAKDRILEYPCRFFPYSHTIMRWNLVEIVSLWSPKADQIWKDLKQLGGQNTQCPNGSLSGQNKATFEIWFRSNAMAADVHKDGLHIPGLSLCREMIFYKQQIYLYIFVTMT